MDHMFTGNPLEIEQALEDVNKAISTTNVQGLLLVREDLQSEIAIAAPVDTPVRNRLSRIEGNGTAHAWYQLQPVATACGRFFGTAPAQGFFARGGLPTATQASYVYQSAPYVSLGDIAQVTFFEQMAGRTFTDVKKSQIKVKMQNVCLMEEWAIINGNSAANPLQFDGLDRLITTNQVDLAGAALTLATITTLMRTVVALGSKPQALIVSLRENQRISELILAGYYRLFQSGAGSMADIPAGVAVTRWVSPHGTIDIIPSRFICENDYDRTRAFLIDDKSMTDDGNAIAMVDLMPISSIDLSLITTAYRTLIAEFTVLMMTIEAFQGKIINIGA